MDRTPLTPYDAKLEKLDWELYDICHAADKFQNMKDTDSRLWQAAEGALKEMRELCFKSNKELADIQAVLSSKDLQRLGAGNPCFPLAPDKQLTLVQQVQLLKEAYVKQVVEVCDPVKKHLGALSEVTYEKLKVYMERNEAKINTVVTDMNSSSTEVKDQVIILKTENENLKKKLSELDATNKQLLDETRQLIQMKNALDGERTRVRESHKQLMHKISNFAENADTIGTSARTLDAESKKLASQLEDGNKSQKKFQGDMDTLKARNDELNLVVDRLKKQAADFKTELDKWNSFISKTWDADVQASVQKFTLAAKTMEAISNSSTKDVKEAQEKYKIHAKEMQEEVNRLRDLVTALRQSFQILGRRLDS